jgi:hypothetical protein
MTGSPWRPSSRLGRAGWRPGWPRTWTRPSRPPSLSPCASPTLPAAAAQRRPPRPFGLRRPCQRPRPGGRAVASTRRPPAYWRGTAASPAAAPRPPARPRTLRAPPVPPRHRPPLAPPPLRARSEREVRPMRGAPAPLGTPRMRAARSAAGRGARASKPPALRAAAGVPSALARAGRPTRAAASMGKRGQGMMQPVWERTAGAG